MKTRILLAAAAASALSLLSSVSANAACCVAYDHNDARQNKEQVISQLSEKINAMQLAIIEAMRLGTGQLSGNSKEQIGAQSNMANVNDDRRVTGNVEMARFNAIRSAASGASSCNAITGGMAAGGLPGNVASLSTALTSDMTKWDIGDADVPSSRGTDVAIQARLERHCSLYANQDDVRSGLCQSAAGGDLQNASIDIAKSLFGKTQSLDQQKTQAAQTFLINAINPRPQGAMLPQEATSAGGREKAAARHAAAARTSIASYVASEMLGRRVAQQNQKTAQWAQSTLAQVPGSEGANFSNGISWYDATEARAKGWYMNPTWQSNMVGGGYEGAIKDGVHIASFQAYMQWETYKLLEKQTIMLAGLLAMQSESSRALFVNANQ